MMAVCAGKTAAADRADGAGTASFGTRTIAAGGFRVVDFGEALFEQVADEGRKFAAGVDFAVRKEGDEVEGGSTTVARASAKKRFLFAEIQDIDQVIFQPKDGVP